VRGKIVSAWSIESDQFDLRITVPPNTTATVHLPVDGDAGISEGGKPIEQSEGVKVLRTDGGEVVLAVGSGDYRFVGRVPGRASVGGSTGHSGPGDLQRG
jgi:alpha-L-rhamnosidase